MKLIMTSGYITENEYNIYYKNMMEEMGAKECWHSHNNEKFQFEYEINFKKDLKFSELLKIKDFLLNETTVEQAKITEGNKTITLFNDRMRTLLKEM